MTDNSLTPFFFAVPSEFRRWLEENYDKSREVWVGFYKKDSGKPSMTWPESVDEALCYGWIDGIRKGIDEVSYTIRFTPRNPNSIWSAVNIKRVKELEAAGLMEPAGLQSFEQRSEQKTAIYSYEQKDAAVFNEASEQQFRAHTKAWDFFQSQAVWYRKQATHWVMSGKREETRLNRLAKLIEESGQGRRV
ncbi:YdeI/OmpD-associated family protein [Paenibacillus eucommiae]|uniref:Uncharacterized protein YdeI (YjbR/CyaY-like superfamily) n=1 Tax=Paenibacillus eucommiae TaxID=1355755 RepID=A0ABS4ISY2_9BACL|nr:YdeI/OmpD-associated family protein [Paenibacillus eucommiae]MBP1990684.1 uncharacterized protein YdeI (YjbR/CyaY-like superfamily) [Paenibacillus eucommiae]